MVVVELVVVVEVDVEVDVDVLVVDEVPRQRLSRHSPTSSPSTGGGAQGHSGGQFPPPQAEPSQLTMQGEPQPGVVEVGGRTGGGTGGGQS